LLDEFTTAARQGDWEGFAAGIRAVVSV
jgi:hypothetical protein